MLYGRAELIGLIKNNHIKISDESDKKRYLSGEGISACNCDLNIGPDCYISSGRKSIFRRNPNSGIVHLDKRVSVMIPPMGIMLFETDAVFNIPAACAFRLSLRMKYIRKGLIMSNQPLGQPGYSGKMFGILMNISNREIEINYKEPMLTLEAMEVMVSSNASTNERIRDNLPASASRSSKKMTMKDFANETIDSSFYEELCEIRSLSKRTRKQYYKSKDLIKSHTHLQMLFFTLSAALVTLLSIIVGLKAI